MTQKNQTPNLSAATTATAPDAPPPATKTNPTAPTTPTLEMTYRISGEQTIEVAATATGVELRLLNDKGKVAERVPLAGNQVELAIEAMRRLTGTTKTGA